MAHWKRDVWLGVRLVLHLLPVLFNPSENGKLMIVQMVWQPSTFDNQPHVLVLWHVARLRFRLHPCGPYDGSGPPDLTSSTDLFDLGQPVRVGGSVWNLYVHFGVYLRLPLLHDLAGRTAEEDDHVDDAAKVVLFRK